MRTRGLTLIELLVVIAIATVLTTLAAPSFQRQVQSARISGAVDTLMSDLRFARGEAMRRSTTVTMCRSANPEAKSPECDDGPQGNGWTSGWIVYYDGDGNKTIDPGEILRVQGRIDSIDVIQQGSNPKTVSKSLDFTPTGRIQHSSLVTLTVGGSAYQADLRRCVALAIGGRARVFKPASTC